MAVQPPLSSAIIITAILHIWTLQMSSQTSRIRQNKMFADKKGEIKVLFSAAKEIRCSRHEYDMDTSDTRIKWLVTSRVGWSQFQSKYFAFDSLFNARTVDICLLSCSFMSFWTLSICKVTVANDRVFSQSLNGQKESSSRPVAVCENWWTVAPNAMWQFSRCVMLHSIQKGWMQTTWKFVKLFTRKPL